MSDGFPYMPRSSKFLQAKLPKGKKPLPTKDEKEFIIDWIANSLTKVDCVGPKDPGRRPWSLRKAW